MNSNKIPLREILFLCAGELIISAIICIAYLIIGSFDYTVLLGALLGSVVTVLNFLFLCLAVNRAINSCLENFKMQQNENADNSITDSEESQTKDEENEEEYDDAAAKFAKENAAKVSNAAKLSYIVRTASMIVALILAFITKQFNVIATVIPLLCLRPILNAAELLRRKEERK